MEGITQSSPFFLSFGIRPSLNSFSSNFPTLLNSLDTSLLTVLHSGTSQGAVLTSEQNDNFQSQASLLENLTPRQADLPQALAANSSSATLNSDRDILTGNSQLATSSFSGNLESDSPADPLTNYGSTNPVPGITALEVTQSGVGEQAKSADTLVDSLGVNVHLAYQDTAYGNFDNLIKPKLQELGIRHIRDGAYQNPTFFNRIQDLGNSGIKSNLIFGGNSADQILNTVRSLSNSVEAVEGVNESDLKNKFPYNGETFPNSTRSYQNYLYDTIKSNPDTQHLTVVMPSMGWAKNALQVGALASGDVGNMHSYPNLGNPPTDGLDWWFIPHAKAIAGNDKPLWSTETGYQNLVGSSLGISETAGGKYIPRLWLDQFNSGVQRIYTYELIDQKPDPQLKQPESHYGLLRNDGSPKPAFNALKNTIALLQEPGASFNPGRLDYNLAGDTTNVKHTLLQKSDGTFYLVLWQETKSWDNTNKVDIAVPPRQVTLNLNTKIAQAQAFNPLDSTNVLWQSANSQQLQVAVPDSPVIVELKPSL